MIEIKEEHPCKNISGKLCDNLIMHWAEDENGVRYYLRQVETGIEYPDPIDAYPCKYTYEITDKKVEVEDGNE